MKHSTKTISLKDFLDNFTDIEDLNYKILLWNSQKKIKMKFING